MESAGPYASLHLTIQLFTGRMPFMPPNQQRQSTEGTDPNPNLMLITQTVTFNPKF